MIEIICDNSEKDESEEGAKTENTIKLVEKLPRNIRQIGQPQGNKRIYVEDYVITYLNYIARPGNAQARGAILLGESKSTEIGQVIFISGAIEAQNLELDMEECCFSEEIWADIYEKIKTNFPNLSVVGWFLSRMGFSVAINDKIEKMHIENFPGNEKVLYISDSLDSEDAFYMYEKGQLKKQKGYYVYYEKNEAMQNYIIKNQRDDMEENKEIKRKDEELIKRYRDKNKNASIEKNQGINLLYIASSFVVLVMVAMGITIANNYDKMKNMEHSLNKLTLTANVTEDTSDTAAPALVIPQQEDNSSEEISAKSDEISTEGSITMEQTISTISDNDNVVSSESNVANTDVSNANTEENVNNSTEAADETIASTASVPAQNESAVNESTQIKRYTVKYGDTLSSIAYTNYGSIEYANDIAKLNNMDVDDRIFEGQELVLP